jgi:hypothetical protein
MLVALASCGGGSSPSPSPSAAVVGDSGAAAGDSGAAPSDQTSADLAPSAEGCSALSLGWAKSEVDTVFAFVGKTPFETEIPSSGFDYRFGAISFGSNEFVAQEDVQIVTDSGEDETRAFDVVNADEAAMKQVSGSFLPAIKKMGIVDSTKSEPLSTSTSFEVGGKAISLELKMLDESMGQQAPIYSVSIRRPGEDAVQLRYEKAAFNDSWSYSGIRLLGVWKSPYDDTLAIVFLLTGRGFEASPIYDVRAVMTTAGRR